MYSVYPHTPSSAGYASDGPTSVAPTSAPSEVSPGHAEELHHVDFDSDQTVTDSTKMIRRRVALIEQRGAIALVPCKRCVKVGRKCTLYRPYYTPWFAEVRGLGIDAIANGKAILAGLIHLKRALEAKGIPTWATCHQRFELDDAEVFRGRKGTRGRKQQNTIYPVDEIVQSPQARPRRSMSVGR